MDERRHELETLLLEPDLFDTCIAIDPSLWWNNEKLVQHAAERLRSPVVPPSALGR